MVSRHNSNALTEDARLNRSANFQLSLASACSHASATRHALGVSASSRCVRDTDGRVARVAGIPDGGGRMERAALRSGKGAKRFLTASSLCVISRSVACESARPVHATMAGSRVGYYSRRERQGTSGASFPGVRNRPPTSGMPAARPLMIVSRVRRAACPRRVSYAGASRSISASSS